MAFLDKLLGIDEVERQRELSDQVARTRFDPNVLSPRIAEATDRSIEGIDEDSIRGKALSSIFAKGEVSSFGGGAGRNIAFLDKLNMSRSEALANVESEIGIADARAKSEASKEVASLQSQQQQIQQERDARIRENRLMAEAEAERRKKQFGSTVGKLAGTVAGSFLGPAGAAIGGGLGGGIFGGGQGAVTGAVTGASSSLSQKRLADFLGTETGQMSIADILGMNKERNELLEVAEGRRPPTLPLSGEGIRALLNF